ncbi:MAG: hypothetical protein ABSB74_19995 [Tepidisphaeraceae bacterium]
MSLREKLNDKKVGMGVAVALLLVACTIFTYYFLSHSGVHVNVSSAYYSDDDGQSYFTDSIYKFAPFDHDGKTAVQAVLAESGGHDFVGYLMRYIPEAQKRLQKKYDDAVKNGLSAQEKASVLDFMSTVSGQMEVKLPGSGHPWLPASQVGTLNVKSPSGDMPDRYITQP